MNRSLVIVRAGDKSLHRSWLTGAAREFDLFVSYFGDKPDQYQGDGEYYDARKGTKYPAIAQLFAEQPELLERYDTFWLADDDLAVSTDVINRMLNLFRGLGLSLAQPALTADSYHSWPLTLEHPDYVVRYTKFVECMAPLFDKPALLACLPTFSECASGYGLDYVWPKLIGRGRRHNIAIIDATPVRHTRPLGGELYSLNPSLSPYADEQRLTEKYRAANIRDIHTKFFFRGLKKVRPTLGDFAVGAIEKTWTSVFEWKAKIRGASPKGDR